MKNRVHQLQVFAYHAVSFLIKVALAYPQYVLVFKVVRVQTKPAKGSITTFLFGVNVCVFW